MHGETVASTTDAAVIFTEYTLILVRAAAEEDAVDGLHCNPVTTQTGSYDSGQV